MQQNILNKTNNISRNISIKSIGWLILPILFLGVFSIALWLTPDPSGIGTHQQLGLPPCFFHYLTGWICPGCGLTTSFSHLAHLQLTEAFSANPFGPILFGLFAFLSLLSLLEFFGKKTPLRKFFSGHYLSFIYVGFGFFILTWCVQIYRHAT